MSYATFEHFNRFFEDFGTLYYGTNIGGTISIGTVEWQADIDSSYGRINELLASLDKPPLVPVGTMKNGSFNSHLIEWNVRDTIFTKLQARHQLEYNGHLPDWILSFGTRCQEIFNGIADNRITFETDTRAIGIGYPSKISVNGVATFYNNWDSGFFEGSDFERNVRVKISGTIDGNNIGQSKFQISLDDGVSYETTETVTGTTWIHIYKGLKIRWAPALTPGTFKQLEYGDTWSMKVTPSMIRKTKSGVKYKRFGIG